MEGNDEALIKNIGQTKLKGLFDFFQDLLKPKKQQKNENEDKEQQTVSTVKPLDIMNDRVKQKFTIFQRLTHFQKLWQAREASKKERNSKELNVNSLIYGEMSFPSFAHMFDLIKNKFGGMQEAGGVFYDLGSGAGKGVLAASLLHPFDRCCGIELLESLHEMGLELKQAVEEQKDNILLELIEIDRIDCITFPEINLVKADFLTYDWSDASVAFAASTCYEPYLMQDLHERSKRLKKGSFFITLTKKFPQSEDWKQLASVNHKMSWGETTVHIYKKITDSKDITDKKNDQTTIQEDLGAMQISKPDPS